MSLSVVNTIWMRLLRSSTKIDGIFLNTIATFYIRAPTPKLTLVECINSFFAFSGEWCHTDRDLLLLRW